LANTNTTNALSGKVSATTASKVNMPNLPPGVASMLHPQYMTAAGLAPAAAFYGLQQPMYGAYGNTGLGDLAAMQRASASAAAGLHSLPTTGYYDPNNQFAAMANQRDMGNTNLANLNSLAAGIVSSASTSTGGNSGNSQNSSNLGGSTSGFGSASIASASTPSAVSIAVSASAVVSAGNSAADSTSSPGPASQQQANTGTGQTGQTGTGNTGITGQQHHQVAQQQQQQQTAFNMAASANAFAQAQQMPPGYAYYLSNMGNMGLQHYGATTPSHVYQPTAMTVPGAGTQTSQFPKSYGTNYGSGYDTLGQQQPAGNQRDFSGSYSSNGQQSKSSGGSNQAGGNPNKGGAAHQYWGNTLTNNQMW